MNMKKLFLLNLPYLLFVYPFDKLAQAFRLAPGADLSGKLLSIGDGFTAALSSPWLSFHPTDLLIGIAGAVVLRMAVYLKGKNAKKYRHGIEYGSARWGTAADIAPYMDKDFFQNIPMTQTERITMASRPKQPKYARNKNILVIGGSGSGKTRFFCKPSLLQAHSSYVCTDPKGTLLPEIGAFLERKKYRIKCLNLINFRKSMKYNPLAYIRSEKDILKLVNALIMNTKGEGEKSSEDFWVKAERLYYSALIGYIWYEATEEEKNFITLLDLINASEAREDDETYQSPVDLLFSQLEEREPDHFAVKQYRKFKMAAGVVCSKRLLNQAVGKSLRTHNLKPKKGAQVMRKNEKITALYERLSRDDFGKDDDQQRESNSISNQKAMLEEFAARQGFTNIVHFTDDGISIGGQKLCDMSLEALNSRISYVAQDQYLFNTSLLENIRLGRLDATDEEVMEAAKKAQCMEFLEKLPQGIHSMAGDAGKMLSGGQRQRISLARAILKDAPIVVLDEATAYADPENEEKMEAAIAELVKGKTLVVIAHKLPAIMNADQICVMDHGKMVATGKHQELIQACPEYQKLWKAAQDSAEWKVSTAKEGR